MRYLLMIILLWVSSTLYAQNSNQPDIETARQTIQGFSKDLKHTLVSTMQADGPVSAIKVCHISAPAITKQHSQTQWHISRTGLKVRNPSNQPEDWIQSILNQFEQRKQNGETVATLEHSEQREDGWYFVKAIPTGKPCLACHGKQLKPEVQTKLNELYPADKATGFKLGDIRGAFVVKKEIFKH